MSDMVQYGGMAVIEGVMMRGPERIAIAVRKPDGSIELEEEAVSNLPLRYPFLKWPLLRGTYVLIDSMIIGIHNLNKSANMSLAEDEEELTTREMVITGLLAFLLAVLLFVVIPTAIVHYTSGFIGGIVAQNIVEGIIRIIFFLGYVWSIGRMQEIERVFMYHGAEHKSILTYEAGEELKVENTRKYTTLHPRCGTSFLIIVLVISILVFALLGEGNIFYRIWSRIVVLPVIAGVSYELLKLSGRYYHKYWVRILTAPGLFLQKLTTREPDDSQIEVALEALKAVLAEKKDNITPSGA